MRLFLLRLLSFFLYSAKEKESALIHLLPLTEEQRADFNLKDEISDYRWLSFRRSGSNSTPDKRPNLFYPIFYNQNTGYIGLKKTAGAKKIIPLDMNGKQRVWRQSKDNFIKAVNKREIKVENKNKDYIVYLKDRIKAGRKPKTIWTNPKYDASSHGTKLLKKIFNESNVFSYPKSKFLIKDIIKITSSKNDIILDFFRWFLAQWLMQL